ncbi:MAG: RNA degradosome polyphosphate kinase, partial [Lachnospiraceae bacterium]|nr:RNA degradosome polyphosphate kinase [Lachnospiraceae bacterium]
MSKQNLNVRKPENYTNRELSWLDFNYRILNEAKDSSNPLFERMKFLSITASNLDEFFMIRVASLKDLVHADCKKPDIAGLTPEEQLKLIGEKTHEFVNMQYNTYNRSLRSMMKKSGLKIVRAHEKLTDEQKSYVDRYFEDEIYPVLTPMAVDSSRPFPLIRNKSLNICALLETKDSMKNKADQKRKLKTVDDSGVKKSGKNDEKEIQFATVQVPSVLPRFVKIPSSTPEETTVILLEEIIERHIDELFLNYKVLCAHPYRVMRNADLSIDEDDAADLLKEIQKQLRKRQWGEAIRLDVEDNIDKRLLKILKKELGIKEEDIYRVNGPIDLTFLMKMYGIEGFSQLKDKKFIPQLNPDINPDENIFEQIKKKDILLHHPYQTFDPVVDFVRQAAKDK